MKKWILTLLLAAGAASAQTVPFPPPPPVAGTSSTDGVNFVYLTSTDTTGALSPNPPAVALAGYNSGTGNFYYCSTAFPCLGAGGGGGGGMIYPAAGIAVSNGTAWTTPFVAPATAGATLVSTADTQTLTNKTVDGVSPATMAFMDATSSVQTQLNGKGTGTVNSAAAYSPAYYGAAGTVVSGATAFNGLGYFSTTAAPVAATAANVSALLGYTPGAAVNFAFPGGLLADYTFNETAGTSLVDQSGNGNNGTITNSTGLTRDGIGYTYAGTTPNIDLPTALNATNTYYLAVNLPMAIVGSTASYFSMEILATSSTTGSYLEILGLLPPNTQGSGVSGIDVGGGSGGGTLVQPLDYVAGPHVITLVCPASGVPIVYLDGYAVSNYNVQMSNCNAIATAGHFVFGPSGRSSSYNPQGLEYLGAAFYSGVHTPAQVGQVAAAIINNTARRGFPWYPASYSGATRFLLFGGDSITCGQGLGCGTGVYSTSAYPSLTPAQTTVHTNYTAQNYGVPGAYVQQQVVAAPYTMGPYCNSSYGQSIAFLMEGTNNIAFSSVSAQGVADLNWAWVNKVPPGCRVGILTGILGNSVADATMQAYWQVLRAQRKANRVQVFVDLGSDPHWGQNGAESNTTYYQGDATHPTAVGQAEIAVATGCVIDAADGTSPGAMDPSFITATSGTFTCAQGGENLNAVGGSINYTLHSAEWMTGNLVQYCNVTPSGSNTVTLTAPSDFPFNNVSGSTTISVAAGTCANFAATFNNAPTAPGDFWQVTSSTPVGTGNGIPVLQTSPTLITPNIGVATATSVNKVTITAPSTSTTLTLANGATLATTGAFSLTLNATATTVATVPSGTITLAALSVANAFTNTITSTSTISDSDAVTQAITATAGGITGKALGGNTAVTPVAGAAAGTTPTVGCAASHVCTAVNGTVTLTTGTSPTTGALFTLTSGLVHTNFPDCQASIVLTAAPYTSPTSYLFTYSTSVWTLNVGTALAASTSYTITYSCLGY
jgi:lysophospholipase L1-like esterase